jgi:hypothetical protein
VVISAAAVRIQRNGRMGGLQGRENAKDSPMNRPVGHDFWAMAPVGLPVGNLE